MAIELVIAENTIALRENTEALNRFMSQSFAKGQAPAIDFTAENAKQKRAPAPKSEPAPAAEPTPTPSPAPEATVAQAAEPTSEAPSEIPYQTVKEGVLSLVKAGKRDKALSILASYGAKTGLDLTVDQYPAVMADINAALGE